MATFRKRSMNFTANEKKLLINLVKEYRSVIEDKRNDASALQKKKKRPGMSCVLSIIVDMVSTREVWDNCRDVGRI